MKNLAALVAILSLLLAPRVIVHAQGTIAFNNLDLSNGRVFIQHGLFNEWGTYPLNQDLNFALYAGPNAFSETVLHVWLLSDGSAKGINVGTGLFADPSHSLFPVAGISAGSIAFVAIKAWAGNYSTTHEPMVLRSLLIGARDCIWRPVFAAGVARFAPLWLDTS